MGRILHKNLNFYLYKIVIVQKLSDRDMANRNTIAERLVGTLSDYVIILKTNEAHFHLPGYINKQNFCYWSEDNPQQFHRRPLHSACVTGLEWQTWES
jgi:hypothetical protein